MLDCVQASMDALNEVNRGFATLASHHAALTSHHAE